MSRPVLAPDNATPIDLRDALKERYLAYALSTITSRSLPDARDGLKPVQRRLLYAMRELKLDPGSAFKKCARVVGDVIGKFHPHGDVAVYEALARLAQDFSQRYPLIDGQGNFGNVDGDNPAAMRYTEARLTAVAAALLDGIDEDTVDFRPTYDGSEDEPAVLPAAFPNLLANGASGIAVGMATSIPPHNAGELFAALAYLLERPKSAPPAALAEVMRFIKGPDLPTGGVLIEPPGVVAEAYATGRGSLRLRAAWVKEDLGYGQYQVIVTEIPYQVQKARLVERLAELLNAKKLALLGDLRDESTEAIRLVLVPRSKNVPAELLMASLFRASDLEVRLSFNMNVLDAAGVPRVMGLIDLLGAFVDHRMVVLVRRSEHRSRRIAARLEILDAYLKAFLDIDRVIQIIRDEDAPKPVLMRAFDLNERQAEAILNLRLRNLRRLEEMALKDERAKLEAEGADLQALLADETKRRKALARQMKAGAKAFAGARRTLVEEAAEIDPALLDAPVERFPITVVGSQKGWVRALRGHVEGGDDLRFKEGDGPRFLLHAQNTDKLLVVATDGRCYLIPADRLPSGRGQGEPLSLLIDLGKAGILDLLLHDAGARLLFASEAGRGFVAEPREIAAQTRTGRQVMNLAGGDRLLAVKKVRGTHVATVGSNRKLLLFPLDALPVMSRGRGVTLQRFKDGKLADVTTLNLEDGLTWRLQGGRTRHEKDLTRWLGHRAGAGLMAPTGFPRDNRFGV